MGPGFLPGEDTASLLPDREMIESALGCLFEPGQLIELRALEVPTAPGRFVVPVEYGYFDDFEKLVAAACDLSERGAGGVYVTLNPVNRALLGRCANRTKQAGKKDSLTSDADILSRRWLLMDCDAKRPAGISATDAEHKAAISKARKIRRRLRREGWPEPILADSGNGAHLLYRLDLPRDDGGKVKRVLEALAHRFDDDLVKIDRSVHNPSRITKLYGTIARKGDHTPERPHRLAEIIEEANGKLVPEELLDRLAAKVEPEASTTQSTSADDGAAPSGGFEIEAWIATKLSKLEPRGPKPWNGGRMWSLHICPWNQEHKDWEAFVGQLANGKITAGCQHDSCRKKKWRDLRMLFEPEYDRKGGKKEEPGAPEEDFEPLDIFGDATLAGAPELPRGVLPKAIENFARDEAKRIGVDPAMIAIPALAAVASVIDDGFKVQPKQHDTTWQESARLWVIAIDEVGGKKTPALNATVKPLWLLQRSYTMANEVNSADYYAATKVYEATLKRRASDPSVPLPVKPTKPPARRAITIDFTLEALGSVAADNPGGFLLFFDEVTGWIGSFDAYRKAGIAKDRPHYLELYNGGPRAIDRKNGGHISIENWGASIIGGTQTTMLRKITGQLTDDGLAQRFVPIFGKGSMEGLDRKPNVKAIEAYENLINCFAMWKAANTDPNIFTLSPEALAARLRVETFAFNLNKLPDTSAALHGHLSKWPGLFARLLLTFHVADHHGKINTSVPAIIPGDTAERVAKLMLAYLLPNAIRFYSEMFGRGHEHARWIAGYILARRCKRITRREIVRAYHAIREDEGALDAAMDALYVAGWVAAENKANGKIPSAWKVNSTVHKIFTKRARKERERRERQRREAYEAAKALGLAPKEEKPQ